MACKIWSTGLFLVFALGKVAVSSFEKSVSVALRESFYKQPFELMSAKILDPNISTTKSCNRMTHSSAKFSGGVDPL